MFLIVNKKVNFYGFVEVMKHFYIIKIKRLTKILNLRWTFFKKKNIQTNNFGEASLFQALQTLLCAFINLFMIVFLNQALATI